MYGKYTVSIKNCIYGLTYIQFILFQHKFRIFVVAYIPTLEKGAAKGSQQRASAAGGGGIPSRLGSNKLWSAGGGIPSRLGSLGSNKFWLLGWDPLLQVWDPINYGLGLGSGTAGWGSRGKEGMRSDRFVSQEFGMRNQRYRATGNF